MKCGIEKHSEFCTKQNTDTGYAYSNKIHSKNNIRTNDGWHKRQEICLQLSCCAHIFIGSILNGFYRLVSTFSFFSHSVKIFKFVQMTLIWLNCVFCCLPWVRGVWQYKDVLEPKLESRGLGIVGIKSVFRRATLR